MLALAISLLWFLIYAICLCGVVWIVLYGINEFIYTIPDKITKGIWFIVFLLVVIALLTLLAGGGGGIPHPNMSFR